jgi:hypothetical protein
LPVSALVKGYSGGGLGYVNKGHTIIRDIVTRRGPKLVDPTDLDTSSFTAYGLSNTAILGVYLPQSKLIREVLDLITVSGSGWWGYVRSSTLFHLEKFSGPSISPDFSINQRRIVSITPIDIPQVVYEVVVKYRENNVVHTEDQVAASIKSTANWSQWTLAYQEQRATDDVLRARYPGDKSISITLTTALQYQDDAQALAQYVLGILKGPKEGWAVTLDPSGLEATIGQSLAISVELQRGIPRLGLNGGENYCTVSVEDNKQDGTTRINVWGDKV